MLIDEPRVTRPDPILAMMSALEGRAYSKRIQQGVYEVGHFGSSDFLRGYDSYPNLSVGAYGVCDDIANLLEKCPELEAEGREFVVCLTKIDADEQPDSGGWRWHKWGEYIGAGEPSTEYIHDEPSLRQVFVYHIYERPLKARGDL
jgi:hypothetical protein